MVSAALRGEDGLLGIAAGGDEDMIADPAENLGIVAALFNAEDVDANGFRRRSANGVYASARSKANANRLNHFLFLQCSQNF